MISLRILIYSAKVSILKNAIDMLNNRPVKQHYSIK